MLLAVIWHHLHGAPALARKDKVPNVHVQTVVRSDFVESVDEIGTVTPVRTVVIRTQLDGQPLLHINFREGQMVKVGQLLAEIDPRPYRIAVEQAQAQLLRDQQLLINAQVDAERYRTLLAQRSVSQQIEVTQDSLVRQDQAQVAADQAALDNAKLQLSYTELRSPVNGRVGIRQVDPGNIVHVADVNGVVSVTQMDPMDVFFSVPQEVLPALQAAGNRPDVELWDRDLKHQITTGHVISHDNQIDITTDTLKLRAEFDNHLGTLFPNEFVNVRLLLHKTHEGLVLPRQAVLLHDHENVVDLVVQGKIEERVVQVQADDGTHVLIRSGLSGGEALVVEGTDKLRPGMKVRVVSGRVL